MPLFDEAGEAVTEVVEIGDRKSRTPTYKERQQTYQMPVMETVTEEYEVEEPDGDRLGLRYGELMCFMMSGS